MKFKVGQKVRGIKWQNMPQGMQDSFGINICGLGRIGVVKRVLDTYDGQRSYDIIFDSNRHPVFIFESELEPFVKVGEQLLLFEL